tara:strand:- start:2919 stop:3134 length:216 start_codon:yes stop_codon:yes gene_type:complete
MKVYTKETIRIFENDATDDAGNSHYMTADLEIKNNQHTFEIKGGTDKMKQALLRAIKSTILSNTECVLDEI